MTGTPPEIPPELLELLAGAGITVTGRSTVALPPRGPGFTCPACDTFTRHPPDVANRYCPSCHWWTGDPHLAWGRPELFTAHGKMPPAEPGLARGHAADLVIVDEIVGTQDRPFR